MPMTQEQKEMYAKIQKDLEAKFQAELSDKLDEAKTKMNDVVKKQIEAYKVQIKEEVEAKTPVAPVAQAVESNQSAAVLAVAHTIIPFTGESKTSGDTKVWCEQVDDVAKTGGIDNKTTAAIAVIRFLPGSPVHRWHKFEKDEDNYPNLNIWQEETDKPGGLRKALMEVFEAKLTRDAIARKIAENNKQEVGEPFRFWYFRFRIHLKKEFALDYEDHTLDDETKKDLLEIKYFNALWQGLRSEPRAWLEKDYHEKRFTTVKGLLEYTERFEESVGGIQFLKMKKPTQPRPPGPQAAAMNRSGGSGSGGSKPGSMSKPQKPREAPAGSCSYCGIVGHGLPTSPEGKKVCYRRTDDEKNGLKLDRHKDYPLKSFVAGQRAKKAAKKAAKAAQQQASSLLAITNESADQATSEEASDDTSGASDRPQWPLNVSAVSTSAFGLPAMHPMHHQGIYYPNPNFNSLAGYTNAPEPMPTHYDSAN
jgi:hypothetical protein